ncbi:MAG: FlgO family outer membrane protein [Micavibrio sp.]
MKIYGLKKAKALLLAMMLAPAVLVAACDPGTLNLLSSPDVNLSNANYAAADMLLQQSKTRVSQNTILALGALSDLKAPDSQAPLGRFMAQQIGTRFVQLGYHVNMPDDIGTVSAGDMPAAPAAPVMAAPLEGSAVGVGNVQAMITGHYVRSGDELLVNIRLVDMGSGQLWGAYDYALPLTNRINEMMKEPISPSAEKKSSGLFGF